MNSDSSSSPSLVDDEALIDPPARLAFEQIVHSYGAVQAVRSVSLEIFAGEILCLLGQSGCGKTTLLRIAAGIERQKSGRVLVDGREIAGPAAFLPPERRGIGLMFQDYALFPHLSVLENVMFGLTRLPREDALREARVALDLVGLATHAADYPHALSGGEQQRAALARALVPRPAVLLMDEPFSGLDRRLRDSIRDDTLDILRETGATALIVTHDPEEAMRMADTVALMRSGRIVQTGDPRDLYQRPATLFAARFFSELNEVPAAFDGYGTVDSPLGIFPVPEGVETAHEMIVGIRPQHLTIEADGPGIPGTVTERRFLGEVDHLEIFVNGLDYPLKARIRDVGRFRQGQDVSLRVAPGDILVFPK